jgi:hypothetical protein
MIGAIQVYYGPPGSPKPTTGVRVGSRFYEGNIEFLWTGTAWVARSTPRMAASGRPR